MTEKNAWGTGQWGIGVWAIQISLESEQDSTILRNWPFDQIYPSSSGHIRSHILSTGLTLDLLDDRIQNVQDAQSITTATDEELEKLAGEVGVLRQTNESDERLRFRARIRKAITRSDGTLRGFTSLLTIIFGEESVSDMHIETPSDEPVVQLFIPSTVVDDVPLTVVELEDALDDAIPMSDRLQIITDDTFIFGESGSQGLSQGGLR